MCDSLFNLRFHCDDQEIVANKWPCHILPFSTSYNDSILKGPTLSSTFHRAFDRGLIATSDNYKVLVHPQLKDYNPTSGIRQYENKELHLPGDERFYPSVKSLREHRERFGWSV